MRVLIHAAAARMGGARTHLLGLVPELAELARPEDRFLLIGQPELLASLPDVPKGAWELRPERAQDRGFIGRLAWEQVALPRLATEWRANVLLSFGTFVPLRTSCPRVLEAGNALPFTRAYWPWVRQQPARVQAEEAARWLLLSRSLRASRRVLVPTRAMRQDVVVRLPELASRVDVVWWGVGEHFRSARWKGRPEGPPRIVGVSKHGLNKEFHVLVAALARLSDRWPGAVLEMTGTEDESRWSRETASLARRMGLAERVRFVGDVPNEQVPRLLEGASALVFPTWCESFGLPLAEGLAMGVPSVAGDIPACREVGGDAALYYRCGDAPSLAERLASLLEDQSAASALSRRALERGPLFDWRENARGTYATLEAAVG